MIADAVIYEVRTQVISSKLEEKLPCMYGSATLAMVWSSNCNTVAPIAHAVIMARWGTSWGDTSWWMVSPGMLATLSSSIGRPDHAGKNHPASNRKGRCAG